MEIVFVDENGLSTPMSKTSTNTWLRIQQMTIAGSNHPFEIRVHTKNGNVISKSGSYNVQSPVQQPAPIVATVNIQSVSANPQTVQVGQQVMLSVSVDNPTGVERAEVYSPAHNATNPLQQTGYNTWSMTRPMTTSGNQSFEMRIYKKGGGMVSRSGSYFVQSAPPVTPTPTPYQPAPPQNPSVSINGVGAVPPDVSVNTQIAFGVNVSNAAGVDYVELAFPDAGVVEQLVQQGNSNVWAKRRVMTGKGVNLPFEIRVHKKGGGVVSMSGYYTVR
jgi:hypothetical protein